jgi:hypothetical protein
MAEEILVGDQLTGEMIECGKQLVLVLDKLHVLVKGAFWLLLPDQRLWRLVIASPEVATSGPKAMYRKVAAAMKRIPTGVPTIGAKDISVVEYNDPIVQPLHNLLKTGPGLSGIRMSRSVVNGKWIEDAYLYRMT